MGLSRGGSGAGRGLRRTWSGRRGPEPRSGDGPLVVARPLTGWSGRRRAGWSPGGATPVAARPSASAYGPRPRVGGWELNRSAFPIAGMEAGMDDPACGVKCQLAGTDRRRTRADNLRYVERCRDLPDTVECRSIAALRRPATGIPGGYTRPRRTQRNGGLSARVPGWSASTRGVGGEIASKNAAGSRRGYRWTLEFPERLGKTGCRVLRRRTTIEDDRTTMVDWNKYGGGDVVRDEAAFPEQPWGTSDSVQVARSGTVRSC